MVAQGCPLYHERGERGRSGVDVAGKTFCGNSCYVHLYKIDINKKKL